MRGFESITPDNIVFSNKIKDLKPSAIREIFKSLSNPDMISLAAGNPSPLSFPTEKIREISSYIFAERAGEALQYSITEGYPKLRKQVSERLASKFGIGKEYDSLIITTGGQQGIDLVAKVLCNEGDTIICENPSFIGALNAFRAYNTHLVGVDLLDDGPDMNMLEQALKDNTNTKFIYTIPTFQNPAGITASLEKRKQMLALAKKYGVFILEDNPYGELRFSGEDVPTIKSLDTDGIVIYTGSFSKILSAGMRVGFLCGREDIITKVVVAKQVNDVHTNIFFQMMASEFIERYGLDDHIASVRELYKNKCSVMLNALDTYMPSEIKYTRPEGGLFIWATLPEGFDGNEFASRAIKNLVAVVSGTAFLPDTSVKTRSFRLNYSMPSDEQIVEGVKRLAKVYAEY